MADELDLGCFSMSLAVADLDRSVAFYEALGFEVLEPVPEMRYRILGNGPVKIGLFEGLIPENVLTFNPGIVQSWPEGQDRDDAGMPRPPEGFTDVREIERRLVDAGLELTRGTETPQGPDHITLVDPDGNQILIDQFF